MKVRSADEFAEKICYLNVNQTTLLYENLKDKLVSLINTAFDFNRILEFLNEEQKAELYELVKDKLPEIIIDSDSLNQVLQNLPTIKYSNIFELINNKLELLIRNSGEAKKLFYGLRPSQTDELYKNIYVILNSLCYSSLDYLNITQHLTDENLCDFYLNKKDVIIKFTENIDDLKIILTSISGSDFIDFCLQKKALIEAEIDNLIKFKYVVKNLRSNKSKYIYNICKKGIITNLVTLNDLRSLIYLFLYHNDDHPKADPTPHSDEFWVTFISNMDYKLDTIINKIDEYLILRNVLHTTNKAAFTIFNELTLKRITALIKDFNDFSSVVNEFNANQLIKVCKFIEEEQYFSFNQKEYEHFILKISSKDKKDIIYNFAKSISKSS